VDFNRERFKKLSTKNRNGWLVRVRAFPLLSEYQKLLIYLESG